MNQSSSRVCPLRRESLHSTRSFGVLNRFTAIGLACFALSWIALCGSMFAQNGPTHGDLESPTPEQIQEWIDATNSSSYAKRDWGATELWKYRKWTVDQIMQSIETSSGDQRSKLIYLLGSMASDSDSILSSRVLEKLKLEAGKMEGSKSVAFKNIYESIRFEIAKNVWDHVTQLCRDKKSTFTSISSPITVDSPLYINDSFEGTEADLVNLELVHWVRFARLEGPKINRKILEAVLKLPKLTHLQIVETNLSTEDLDALTAGPDLGILEIVYTPVGDEVLTHLRNYPVTGTLSLFGTELSENGITQAREMLSDIDTFLSRGAFLGVHSNAQSVIVSSVEPGSAADIARLQPQDRLNRIDGVPLSKFEDLRQELAKHSPGDKVLFEIERNGFTLEVTVELGRRMR